MFVAAAHVLDSDLRLEDEFEIDARCRTDCDFCIKSPNQRSDSIMRLLDSVVLNQKFVNMNILRARLAARCVLLNLYTKTGPRDPDETAGHT